MPVGVGEERRRALDQAIATRVGEGADVVWHSDYEAVLIIGSEPNHLVHAIVTFFVFIWAAVWLGLYLRSRQQRRREILSVDDSGRVTVRVV